MAIKKKLARATLAQSAPSPARMAPTPVPLPHWGYLAGCAIALFVLFQIYSPVISAPFVFDDLYLPYAKARAASIPLRTWLGVRPVLGLSFWTDFQLWGQQPLPFHINNLLLHFACALVFFFVLRKFLAIAATPEPRRITLAVFGAALFLVHPMQSEVAAYVASRSEALSVLFFLAALCAFLYRKTAAINWPATALVVFFFLLALGSKEHTVTFPALLLLTDYFWNPAFSVGGIRANWRLYLPISFVGFLGALFVLRYVSADPMIGFHVEGLTPLTYFLTECRAVFKYLQLFLFPYSQNVDYDFPLSHTFIENGALFALAGLLLISAAAILFRKLYPFASYGWLVFLLLLAPTSSFVPINDVLVERRLYLPFLGLVLILFEPLRRLPIRASTLAIALAAVCSLAAYGTWQRAHVWTNVMELFRDAAGKSPAKARVHIGYANALYHAGRCREAVDEYGIASRLKTTDFVLYFNLAAAYDCISASSDAIEMLNRSNAIEPRANTYALLGKVLSKEGKLDESLAALDKSLELDYTLAPTYAYRGAVYAAMGKPQLAYADYTECLRRDPGNNLAQQGIALLTRRP